MDSNEVARLLDPEAWQSQWSTLGDAIEIQTRRERSETYARRLVAAGYAVVKLPDMVVDEWEMRSWPVDGDSEGVPRIQIEEDGRIAILSVPNPCRSPEQAASLGAALLAASRESEENRDGDG